MLTSIVTPPGGVGNGETVGAGAFLGAAPLALLHTAHYDLTTRSLAFRVVHLAGATSTTQPYTAAELDAFLRQVFGAAVVQFTSVTQLADMSVNWDLDQDGYLDTSYWRTPEMEVIIQQCDQPGFHHIMFIVDNGSYPGGLGFMQLGQKWGFIHPNLIVSSGNDPRQVTAHELGHGAFGLRHTTVEQGYAYNDPNNLMWPYAGSTRIHLRKDQWDVMHPR